MHRHYAVIYTQLCGGEACKRAEYGSYVSEKGAQAYMDVSSQRTQGTGDGPCASGLPAGFLPMNFVWFVASV